jgi:hypothetical protein
MKRGIITIIICASSFCAQPAQAELVTIQIEGVVDSVSDDYGYLEGKIKPGDIITGFYTYESTTPDSNPLSYVGDYLHHASPCGISLTVGGFEFKTDPANVYFLVEIVNSVWGDNYSVKSNDNLPLSNGVWVGLISWQLDDPTGNALSSDVLPTTAPVLDDWQSIYGLRLDGWGGKYPKDFFTISSHVTSAIPEPATFLLFAFGGGLLLRKRR